ncbi:MULTISPECIES: CPBP family intramembrane glutamic endopeptidase [unclassified Corynebacterium]|uniref:CPBP family intramembrane glutamic endopeptidase n=1 Tax=unclassified Corynebacterium TaxID=2624378 RepID=UPI0029CA8169|nr:MULTISPECIES: CPBP family intramembrane glutamic endopeptidase [unclassified Corynebacterium]WPF66775.1 CPBP family intramembrane metalloprotease [Corynebacterium sp. 22KM0430]WPF69263.1 CPBP family intramembrane metalloprotease [Corynebacterium sp. 21KM1197]
MTFYSSRIPVIWWGLLLRAVVAAVMILGANALGGLVSTGLEAWGFATSGARQAVALIGQFFLVALLVVGMVAGWVRWVERGRLRPLLGSALAGGGAFRLGTAIIVPLMVGIYVLRGAVAYANGQLTTEYYAQYPTGAELALSVLYVLTVAYVLQGFPEELIYRGWLMEVTRQCPWLTLTWTTVAFTVIHLISSGGQESWGDRLIYLILPLGMGLLAGALRIVTGSLWAGVATHGGMHVVNNLVPPVVPVTGFDLAGVVLPGVAQAMVAAVILWRWHGRSRARGPILEKPAHEVGC